MGKNYNTSQISASKVLPIKVLPQISRKSEIQTTKVLPPIDQGTDVEVIPQITQVTNIEIQEILTFLHIIEISRIIFFGI